MIAYAIFGGLAALSLALTLWQWLAARRFPLHQRSSTGSLPSSPALTLLKPLKGCDAATEDCLRSWMTQRYPGPLQVLFGVASPDDPVCIVVRQLLAEFPRLDAELVITGPPAGTNAKVSQLVFLEQQARHEFVVISDADVKAPEDLLTHLVGCFQPVAQPSAAAGFSTVPVRPSGSEPGLACCFYRLANPATLAMQWEAVAINADFWSQVLQSQSLQPMDFALGAVMALRRDALRTIGGFASLLSCLADDYQLGHRLARAGYSIALSPVVVECRSAPMGWKEVWQHQLRWARTIRVCQPLPYFFSLLSNATLWPLAWLGAHPVPWVAAAAGLCLVIRIATALDLQRRLASGPAPSPGRFPGWLVPVKDLLQVGLWLLAFLGNRIEWRGRKLRLRRDGELVDG